MGVCLNIAKPAYSKVPGPFYGLHEHMGRTRKIDPGSYSIISCTIIQVAMKLVDRVFSSVQIHILNTVKYLGTHLVRSKPAFKPLMRF